MSQFKGERKNQVKHMIDKIKGRSAFITACGNKRQMTPYCHTSFWEEVTCSLCLKKKIAKEDPQPLVKHQSDLERARAIIEESKKHIQENKKLIEILHISAEKLKVTSNDIIMLAFTEYELQSMMKRKSA